MMGMGFGFGALGLVLMIVFWLVVIGLAVCLLSNLFPRTTDSFKTSKKDLSETPMEILQQRYARGEISRDEYNEMRKDLQTSGR
ncbi:MAG: SHOCT domain-containing protein [Anaerolineaceae bacterium]|nr:MAG: SHOCT domain-containing protein [Anaerolineaceae bacterium]